MSIQHPSTVRDPVKLSPSDLFATELPKILNARRDIAQSIGAVCVFRVDGDQWTVDLKNAKVTAGDHKWPDMRLEMTLDDFQALIGGRLDAVDAIRAKRLSFYGNPNLLVGFAALIRDNSVN